MSRSENDTILIESELPIIASVKAAEDFWVEVTWKHGSSSSVDLAADILTFKVYAPLREDRQLFESVNIADEGNAISWGDGKIDMPATAVERLTNDKAKGRAILR